MKVQPVWGSAFDTDLIRRVDENGEYDHIWMHELSVEEMCKRMDYELHHLTTGSAYYCNGCQDAIYDDRKDKSEPFVCPFCGSTSESFEEIDLADEWFDYHVDYRIFPFLWDRGYLDVNIDYASPCYDGYLVYDSMEAEIRAFNSDRECIYVHQCEYVDYAPVHKAALDSIEDGLKYMRRCIDSDESSAEQWVPILVSKPSAESAS